MANTSILGAVADRLKASTKVTSLLGDGVNSIVLSERVTQGFADSIQMPCIAIQDMGDSAGARSLPWFDHRVNIRVYDALLAPNAVDYTKINNILQEVIDCLHHAPLTTNMSYGSIVDIYYDGFSSPASIDPFAQLPCKYARFCVKGAFYRFAQSAP